MTWLQISEMTETQRWWLDFAVRFLTFGAGFVFFIWNLESQRESLNKSLEAQNNQLIKSQDFAATLLEKSHIKQRELLSESIDKQRYQQRSYEREKLKALFQHLGEEIKSNIGLVHDTGSSVHVGIEEIKRKDSTFIYYTLASTELKTVIWETANTKDYFFQIDTIVYAAINKMYTSFYRFNFNSKAFENIARLVDYMRTPAVDTKDILLRFYLEDQRLSAAKIDSLFPIVWRSWKTQQRELQELREQ